MDTTPKNKPSLLSQLTSTVVLTTFVAAVITILAVKEIEKGEAGEPVVITKNGQILLFPDS